MNLDAAMQTFFQESKELLAQMEQNLLELEKEPANTEALGALFRAVHTLKGSAGMFQFENIVKFAHIAENILDLSREGSLELTGDLVSVFLTCHDHLEKLVEVTIKSGNEALPEELENQGELIMSQLSAFQPTEDKSDSNVPDTYEHKTETIKDLDVKEEEKAFAELPVAANNWHISLRFGRDVFRHGLEPMSFFKYLNKLGNIVNLVTLPDALPELNDFDPESCYLGFEIDFQSEVDKASIEKVFEFVQDDCRINILPPYSKVSRYRELIHELPETPMRIGEILHFCGALSKKELEQALADQFSLEGEVSSAEEDKERIGKILVEQKALRPEVLNAALDKQKKSASPRQLGKDNGELKGIESHFIRVDAEKLDQLINLIGELVIASASVNDQAEGSDNSALVESVSQMGRLVSEIRDTTLNVRMVQIGETFNRYRRVVRDLSKEMGKNVDLVISGGETELDKTIVEKITDPLTHLIRNAMDHGIDSPEERQSKGKPQQGTIQLNSFQETGTIVIEVTDDGNGLDREKIFAKAVALGLIEPNEKLTDKELFRFIFNPGFSTAKTVTAVSGRGVGMDVVKQNIESLRGTVDIESEAGKGTKVRIRLPLTLAIIDGFLVEVGNSQWVIPLDMVEECVDFSHEEKDKVETADREDFINLRGEVLPFLRLGQMFGVDKNDVKQKNIVVVEYAGQKAGLMVDKLIGEFQTVIKSLGPVFQNLRGISGATILGNGKVALIIDVPRLVQHAKDMEENAQAAKKNL